MLQIVVIGSGGIAHTRHIPNIKRSDRAVLRGVYNRRFSHSQQDAKRFECKAYATLDEVWADAGVDAVIICTPASTHCEYALAALEAGKHVLCEKPMSVTAAEARRMQEAQRHVTGKLMISHNQRYYQPHQKAKELLDAGVIGTVLNVRSSLGLELPMLQILEEDNNAGSEVLSHRLDLMHYLLSSKAAGVIARLTRVDDTGYNRHVTGGEDTAMAIIHYQNGVVASFVASRVSYNGNDRMTQIFGTKGSITLYGQKTPVCVELAGGEAQYYDLPDVPGQRTVELTGVDEAFFRCIEQDSPVPISAEDGLEVMVVLEALYKSNQAGCYVELNRQP